MAKTLGIGQNGVTSRTTQRFAATLRSYIEAMGGQLLLIASSPTVSLSRSQGYPPWKRLLAVPDAPAA